MELLQPSEGTQFPTLKEMREKAHAFLEALPFDTTVRYGEFEVLLGLNPQTSPRARNAVLKAGRDLLRAHSKKLVNVKNDGYRIVRPNEQVDASRGEQRRARRWYRRALETVTYVDFDRLTPAETSKTLVEQGRAAIHVAMGKRLVRAKNLPPRAEIALPSPAKLVEMLRRSKG